MGFQQLIIGIVWGRGSTDQASAVEADEDGVFARLGVFGDLDIDRDGVVIDLFVGGGEDFEFVEFLDCGCG